MLTWEQFGEALSSLEGWRFRLLIEDRGDDALPEAEVIPLDLPDHVIIPAQAAPTTVSSPTIAEALTEFLADQEKRLAARTYHRYAEVVTPLTHCLNSISTTPRRPGSTPPTTPVTRTRSCTSSDPRRSRYPSASSSAPS